MYSACDLYIIVLTVSIPRLNFRRPERVLERCDSHSVGKNGDLSDLPLVTSGPVIAAHPSLAQVKVTLTIRSYPRVDTSQVKSSQGNIDHPLLSTRGHRSSQGNIDHPLLSTRGHKSTQVNIDHPLLSTRRHKSCQVKSSQLFSQTLLG